MTLPRRGVLGVALAAGTLPLSRLARGAVAHRLTILHLNDFHSRHEPVDGGTLACAADRPGCFGGAARLATLVAVERAAAEADGRAVLLLDAGDQFQGSLFYTTHKGDAELAVMHAIGTEAMALGNHEFDDGPANLARFIRAARFPVLSANIDASAEPALAGLIRPRALFEKGELRIGVVGLTTQDTPIGSSPGPNLRFTDPAAALAREAASCRAEGAALVVALSHLGLPSDLRLAGAVPGVALFVGGHTHALLSNSEPGTVGPHPMGVDGPGGRGLVVQAAAYGRYLGRLDLDLAEDGAVLTYGGDCRHVGLDLPEDPGVAAVVAEFARPFDAVRRRMAGRLPEPLGIALCRVTECALGNLVADAMLAAVRGADAAIMNGGGLRTGLPGGEVTLGDVMQAVPFGNTLATLTLRGSDLRAAVAHGLSVAGRGGFPQVAGLRITWNPLASPEDRLVSLAVRGEPVEPDRLYRVVTNDFLRRGGDGYAVLRDRAIEPYDAGPGLDQVVAAALGRLDAPPDTDGRISLP